MAVLTVTDDVGVEHEIGGSADPNAVTAAAVIADNAILRGDGGARGAQTSSPTISDTGVLSVGDIQEIVVDAGVTIEGVNLKDSSIGAHSLLGHITMDGFDLLTGTSVAFEVKNSSAWLFQATGLATDNNNLGVTASATGVAPSLKAFGTEANISIDVDPKGTGVLTAGGVEVATISGTQTLTNKTIANLTDDGMADALHRHSELSASDGTPNQALIVDATGQVGIGTASPQRLMHIEDDLCIIRLSDANSIGDTITSFVEFYDRNNTKRVGWFGYGTTDDLEFVNAATAGEIIFQTQDTDRVVIDASGKVGIGRSAPDEMLDIQGNLQLVMQGDGTDFISYTYSGAQVFNAPAFISFRARGTEASPAAVLDGDRIGIFQWRAHDGTSFNIMASIEAEIEGTVSTGNTPTQLLFKTGTAASRSTRMTIAPDGGIHLAALKSGTDQTDAGAAAGELYSDTNDDNTVKIGV